MRSVNGGLYPKLNANDRLYSLNYEDICKTWMKNLDYEFPICVRTYDPMKHHFLPYS